MHAKNNRQNHDFQILHFLVGSCHTPDGAYALLQDLREDRLNALKMSRASAIKEEGKVLSAKRRMKWHPFKSKRLEAEGELAEIAAMSETNQACILAAQDELRFIELLMSKLEPHREFGHLSIRQANEATQHNEWKFELMKRAENFLLSGNGIPADHYGTMRMHPEWTSSIEPHIKGILLIAREAATTRNAELRIPLVTTPLSEVKLDTLLLENNPSA